MNKQTNMSISQHWKKQLEQLARIESVKEEKNVSYLDMMRRAIAEKYNLEFKEGEKNGKD